MAKIKLSHIVLLSFINCMSIQMRENYKSKEDVNHCRFRASDLFESCLKHSSQHKYCYTFYEYNETKYPKQFNMFVKELQLLEKFGYVNKKDIEFGSFISSVVVRPREVVDYQLTESGKQMIKDLFVNSKPKTKSN